MTVLHLKSKAHSHHKVHEHHDSTTLSDQPHQEGPNHSTVQKDYMPKKAHKRVAFAFDVSIPISKVNN